MIGGIDDLYQEVILQHSKRPRNFGVLDPHSHHAEGFNPLCGDRCDLTLQLAGDVIEGIGFDGAGCAISTASASLMTEAVKGLTVAEADALFARVRALLTTDEDVDLDALSILGHVGQLVSSGFQPLVEKGQAIAVPP